MCVCACACVHVRAASAIDRAGEGFPAQGPQAGRHANSLSHRGVQSRVCSASVIALRGFGMWHGVAPNDSAGPKSRVQGPWLQTSGSRAWGWSLKEGGGGKGVRGGGGGPYGGTSPTARLLAASCSAGRERLQATR